MTHEMIDTVTYGTLALSAVLFLWKAPTIGRLTFQFHQRGSWFNVPFSAKTYERAYRIIGGMFAILVILRVAR